MSRESERILITGYKGFVASHLVAACKQRYPTAHLFGLVHQASQPQFMDGAIAPLNRAHLSPTAPQVTELEGDITDGARIGEVLRETKPDLIFHLAAVSSVAHSWQDPFNVLRINAGGFLHLAESVRTERLTPRIIVVGSGEQYGLVRPEEIPVTEETLPRPANPYAVSKVTQDLYAFQYFKAFGLDTVRARPLNHFGPGQSADFVLASFARQIALIESGQVEPTLLVGNLSAQRDFLAVDDVARAYLALAEHGESGEAYNIGSGVARSIESMLGRLLRLTSATIEVRVDPARFRPAEVPTLCADTTKIQRDTGWLPSSGLEDALLATLNYWRQRVHA